MRPFIVTEIEAGKLPRWGLLLLSALYILPGLVGRDPWRTEDASGFGIALTMARGLVGDWLMPNIAGDPFPAQGPLPYWIYGASARLGAPWSADLIFTEHAMVRLASALLLAATLALLWYTSFALARRPGVQPSDPFGASAGSTDFGRAIADSVLLVAMATIGLITRMHETTGDVAQLTWVAAFLFGCASAPDRPVRGGAIAGAAIAATALSRGLPLAIAMLAVLLALPMLARAFSLVRRPMLACALPVALVGALAWPLALATGDEPMRQHLAAWLQAQAAAVSGPTTAGVAYFARTAPWFYWPAWPVATWAIWRWRTRWTEPAVALPLAAAIAFSLQAFIAPEGVEGRLLPAALPLALLAGVGLPTLRRGIVSLIDWFALCSFTLFGIAIWAWWIALMTGYPPRMAYRASQLAPGFVPTEVLPGIALGILASLAWLGLVRWRIARRPRMIWRAMALSCGGLVLAWFLLMTLWLPVFNERNTYRDVALGLRGALAVAPDDCVGTRGLGPAQRASFLYFAQPHFESPATRMLSTGSSPIAGARPAAATGAARACGWLLIQDDGPIARTPAGPMSNASLAWQGQRRAERGERFRLYRLDPVR